MIFTGYRFETMKPRGFANWDQKKVLVYRAYSLRRDSVTYGRLNPDFVKVIWVHRGAESPPPSCKLIEDR